MQGKDINDSQLDKVAGGGPDPDDSDIIAEEIAKLVDAFNAGKISKEYLFERKNELISYLPER